MMKISFASDLEEIVRPLTNCRPIWRWLKGYSDKLRSFILVHGMIEMEELYRLFCDTYKETVTRTDFFRFVYWHARFNNLIQTMYTPDGTCYAAACQIDGSQVLADREKYAADMDYKRWTKSELVKKADGVMENTAALQELYAGIMYGMGLPEPAAEQIMEDIVMEIKNGWTLTEIMEETLLPDPEQESLMSIGAMWTNLADAMLEMELPMLKGRSRKEYASLKNISPWEVGMVLPPKNKTNTKDRHIWEFSVKEQENIYLAWNEAVPGIEEIWEFAEKENIWSEEYLFLLADICSFYKEKQKVRQLIRRLKKSSARGREAAEFLELDMDGDLDRMLNEMDFAMRGGFYEADRTPVQMPYVRTNPKIGRNDPCPCGSGKKYKKCCGK